MGTQTIKFLGSVSRTKFFYTFAALTDVRDGKVVIMVKIVIAIETMVYILNLINMPCIIYSELFKLPFVSSSITQLYMLYVSFIIPFNIA